jgi:hypothetical protein
MQAYQYEAMDWSIDLSGRNWRVEAALGVNKGQPFAGVRMVQYSPLGMSQARRFQVWEESLLIVPSTPSTAMIAIGNVLSGAINHMYEENARLNAEEARRRAGARHRRS